MTPVDIATVLPTLSWHLPRLVWLRDWFIRRQTRLRLGAIDDRQRRDIGLGPVGVQPVSAANVAARIAMLASR